METLSHRPGSNPDILNYVISVSHYISLAHIKFKLQKYQSKEKIFTHAFLRYRKRMHALPKFHRTCSNKNNNASVIGEGNGLKPLKNHDYLVHARVNV